MGECPAESEGNWEWRRLRYLCDHASTDYYTKHKIEAVAFSPDGKRFATGGWGGSVYVWDIESKEELLEIATGGEYVFAVTFSPDGKYIATGANHRPGFVKIWDAQTGELFKTLSESGDGHTDTVVSVAYSKDGARLLTSSYDKTARLWDLDSGTSRVFKAHYDSVWSAAFSPDEKKIVTAGQDGSVVVWHLDKEDPEPPFLGHKGPVYTAAFSPDGRHVVSAGFDKQILIWDPRKVREFDYEVLLEKENDAANPPREYQALSLSGHTASVRSVHFSLDGQLVLSSGNDNTARIWDPATGELLKTLRGHGGWAPCCEFFSSADGYLVLSGSLDGKAKIWRLQNNKKVLVFGGRVLQKHGDAILGASFSDNGKQVVTAGRDRSAIIWDFATGEVQQELKEGHEFLASTGVFFPVENKVLTAAVDGTARVWDVATGAELFSIEGTGPSAAVALSPDGKWILTGGVEPSENGEDEKDYKATAKIWNASTGKLVRTLKGHDREVTAVAISSDGKWAFTGDAAGVCRLFDAESGDTIRQVKQHTRGVTAASFLGDGRQILTASLDSTVILWEADTGRVRYTFRHDNQVWSMAVSPNGKQILTVWVNETKEERDEMIGKMITRPVSTAVTLWDIGSGKEILQLPVGKEIVTHVAFSPDDQSAVTTSSRDKEEARDGQTKKRAELENFVRLWDLQQGQEILATTNNGGPFLNAEAGSSFWSAMFSPDGKSVLTVGGNEARLWDLKTGREIMEYSPHDPVASASFSPDGALVATGGWDATVKIWQSRTGKVALRLDSGHEVDINSIVFSPNGDRVLTASSDGTAILRDIKSGQKGPVFQGHQGPVRSAAFSDDGTRVVTASDDTTARIWDAETGDELWKLEGHSQAVLCTAFSADGKWVITGSEDNSAIVWNARTGEKHVFSKDSEDKNDNPALLLGHTAAVTSVAFLPDGQRVITGSKDHTAKIWELKTGKEVLTLRGHSEEVTSVAFSPDGKTALTASRDGTVVLWLTSDD